MDEKAKMGRPRKEINPTEFEDLCALLCTEEDIANFFKVSVDTIERFCQRTYGTTFAEIYKKESTAGKVSLRRKQYEIAIGGNVTMLIWLGKVLLGQREEVTVTEDPKAKRIKFTTGWGRGGQATE